MTATVTPYDQLLFDLFVTALEGGIGYWSQCSSYHWSNEDGSEDHTGFAATIVEMDTIDPVVIDRALMVRGYRRATEREWRNRLAWSTGKPPFVVNEDTDWDFDAGDADMIVQLGLFNDVVYG